VEAIGGPHHYVGGAKGGPAGTQLAGIKLGPEQAAPSLPPALLPDETIAEDLPSDGPKLPPRSLIVESAQEAAQPPSPSVPVPTVEVAKMDAVLPLPASTASLPPPPPAVTLPETSDQPLIKTNVYVQVGAFGNVANAEKMLDKLRAYEPSASLSKIEGASGTLTRVRSGPYGTIGEAEAKMQALVSAGFDGARLVVERR